MKFHIETERLILREFREEDAPGILKLNADLEVIKYLHMPPMKILDEAKADIEYVQNQYARNGIGRWVMLEKSTGKFMGWTGLKLEEEGYNGQQDFYDVGYRMIPEFWGKGYATESAIASVKYGFEEMNLDKIIGAAHINNLASRRVLLKTGLQEMETFPIDDYIGVWYEITK